MRQIIQDHKSGTVRLEEVPAPGPRRGRVLVATRASLVSAGTERHTVSFGRANLLDKARSRPDLVRQVLLKARTDGLVATWKAAEGRLQDWVALGYSSAGVVLDVGEGVEGLKVGDRVACAGQDRASHAELVSLPPTLVAPLPPSVGFDVGAFATVGAIALHGIHRAQVGPGDRVAVIGLGLLGQLAVQILSAYGNPVIGIDVRKNAVAAAISNGASIGAVSGVDDVDALVAGFTGGVGVDAVVVTAATASSEPLATAARIARKRGRVCVVGLVGMEADRRIFYDKELELVVAKSYGPGRDDPNYEGRGIDYPLELSRWTIARNMGEFLRLAGEGRIRLEALVAERVPLSAAPEAYDRLVEGRIPEGSILIEYANAEAPLSPTVTYRPPQPAPAAVPRVGFLGAGAFARAVLLPALAKSGPLDLRLAVAGSPPHAAQAARRFGFAQAATDAEAALAGPEIDTVFIATRHDTHAAYAERALRAGKHVFVEKPLGLTVEEVRAVLEVAKGSPGILQVGFNRRFAPMVRELRDHFAGRGGPLLLTYRVNAGPVPPTHWTRDPKIGGGRILGEVCHFVDTLQFLVGAPIVRVLASGGTPGIPADDHLAATLEFSDGSRGTILYSAAGPTSLPKERLEVLGAGRAGVLDNFRSLELWSGGRSRRSRSWAQDKGHQHEVKAFLDAVRGGERPMALEDIAMASLATLAIQEAVRTGEAVDLTRLGRGEEA